MESGAGAASTPGSGGAPGAGGAPNDYTGDTYLALDTTGSYSLAARGLDGDLTGYVLTVTALYHGPGTRLAGALISVNGREQGNILSLADSNDGVDETLTGTAAPSTCGVTCSNPIGSLLVTPGDLVQIAIERSGPGSALETAIADLTSAKIAAPDGSNIVAWP